MVKMTEKKLLKIINFALKHGSTVIRNSVKTQNCHIQVPKKTIDLEIWNFAELLKLDQIDGKKF